MDKYATIIQYTHNTFTKKEVNGVELESKLIDRQHHYQIKFNNEDEHEFVEFVFNKGSSYEFEMDTNTNEPPEEYSCWCECMEEFLIHKGYKLIYSNEKSDTWKRKRYIA